MKNNNTKLWWVLPLFITLSYFLFFPKKGAKSKKANPEIKNIPKETKQRFKKQLKTKNGSRPNIQIHEDDELLEPENNLNQEEDPSLRNVYKDLHANPFEQEKEELPNLDDQIAFEMEQATWWNSYQAKKNKEERQAFIQQFLENAKKAGYKITLDKNLNVTKVEKLPPKNYDIIIKE